LMSFSQKLLNQIGSDKSGAAGDKIVGHSQYIRKSRGSIAYFKY
jgi:hypothetical protein